MGGARGEGVGGGWSEGVRDRMIFFSICRKKHQENEKSGSRFWMVVWRWGEWRWGEGWRVSVGCLEGGRR